MSPRAPSGSRLARADGYACSMTAIHGRHGGVPPSLMHARELAELAALIAVHAPSIVQRPDAPRGLNEPYWAASRCRLDRWSRLLRQLTAAMGHAQLPATLSWPRTGPVLEEIIVTELLTRIWTATAAAHDAARSTQDLEPVARNVLAGHLDARRRLLTLMADDSVIDLSEAARLNQFRRRVERWTDMLLAHLADSIDIAEFAFEPERACDFADDLDHGAARADLPFTSQLVLVSLRASFADGVSERSPNRDLNRHIGSALLGAFPSDAADTAWLAEPLWLQRIHQSTSDAEGMIEELLLLDSGRNRSLD
jgi:hypothetical protein